MIEDLDEALRKLLIRELPIKNGEVDIQFHQPKREWSARLSRPTLNLFLYAIRENAQLRQHSPGWVTERSDANSTTQRRRPVKIDLQYLITAWANEPEDEHRLLARATMALFRFPYLPEEVLPDSLQHQPGPIAALVAQAENLPNPSDFWGSMDNEIHPILPCLITLSLDPYQPYVTPLVHTREMIFRDADSGASEGPPRVLWGVAGSVRGARPLASITMRLVAEELEIPVTREGAYTIRGVPEGVYTLEISVAGGAPSLHKLTVPGGNYIIEL